MSSHTLSIVIPQKCGIQRHSQGKRCDTLMSPNDLFTCLCDIIELLVVFQNCLLYSIFFVLLHRSPGRSSPSFQLLVMNPGFFMSCRKGTKNPLKLTFPLSFLFPCKSTPFWIPHQVNNHQLLHTNTQNPCAIRSCHPTHSQSSYRRNADVIPHPDAGLSQGLQRSL